jgi:pimeloyl-ACP methyl ester carboxylesterase
MILGAALTTARLLVSFSTRRRGPRDDVEESRLPTLGFEDSLGRYEPRRKVRATLVLVHGVTGRGNEDPSLVHLARTLASLGLRCAVPTLRGLASFCHDPSDVASLVDTIVEASRWAGGQVGVLGFSYGAAYALSAAGDPRATSLCRAVVGFGAYHQLGEALSHQRQLLVACPDPSRDDADTLYLRYTLLWFFRRELGLSEDALAAIWPVLVHFTSGGELADKRRPLLQHGREVDYVELMDRYRGLVLSKELSPAERLSSVQARVGLLHDPADRFVPPGHARLIADVLDRRVGVAPTQLLMTPMLSHVHVHPLRRLGDVPGLMRLLQPLWDE